MNWLRQNFDSAFLMAQVMLDGLCLVGAFLLSVCLFSDAGQDPTTSFTQAVAVHRSMGVVAIFMTLFCYWLGGLYQWQKSILNVEEYRSAFKAGCVAFLLCAAYFFLFKHFDRTIKTHFPFLADTIVAAIAELLTIKKNAVGYWHKAPLVGYFVVSYILIVLQRFSTFGLLTWFHRNGYGNSNVLVYGSGALALGVEQKMRLFPFLGFNFLGFVDNDPQLVGKRIGHSKVLGLGDNLEQVCEDHQVCRVIVAKQELEGAPLQSLCMRLDRMGIEYMLVPRLHHLCSQRFVIVSLDTIPLLHPIRKAGKIHVRLFKRCFDLLFGAALFLFSLPLFLILGVLVKLKSKGPILFSQTRVGIEGRSFKMYKFRTMHSGSCGASDSPKQLGDPRIVPGIGPFLRRTSLDELPQLINVLRGEMSLVGPRPEMQFIVDTYDEMELGRLSIKPGLTGLWQVSEGRNAPIHENLDYDLYYIENQSIFLDVVILGLTVFAVPFRGNS